MGIRAKHVASSFTGKLESILRFDGGRERKMSSKTLNSQSSAEEDSAEEMADGEEEESPAPKTKAKGGKAGKKVAAAPSKSVKKVAEIKEDEENIEDEDVEDEEEDSPAPKTKAKGGKSSKKAAAPSKSVKATEVEEDEEVEAEEEEEEEEAPSPVKKPKKTAAKKSSAKNKTEEDDLTGDDDDAEDNASPPKKAKIAKPKTTAGKSAKTDSAGSLSNKEMILKAIEALDDKTGASVMSIKNYITEHWPEKAESSQFSNNFKKAITTLAEENFIVRPKKQEDTPIGATGSYKINKEKEKAAKEKEKDKAAKEKEKDKAAKEKEKEKIKAAKEKEKEKSVKEKEKVGKASTSAKTKEGTKAEPSGPLNNKEMIIKALEDLDEKNGSSVVAIKNYI